MKSISSLALIVLLASCKVTNNVNQSAIINQQGSGSGRIKVTQQASTQSGATVTSSSTGSSTASRNSASITSATASASLNNGAAKASVVVGYDPIGIWSGRFQGDAIQLHLGNSGDVRLTDPDGSVSGAWSKQADGSLRINLRNDNATLIFSGSNSAILHRGFKQIAVTR